MSGNTNANEIVVPTRTELWLALVGTAPPVLVTDELPDNWFNAGFTTEDSMTFNDAPEFADIRSAQADLPVLTYQTSETVTVGCDLQQWNRGSFRAVFGGGTFEEILVSASPTGNYKFTPPSKEGRQEFAALLRVTAPGSRVYNLIFPRTMQREGVQTDLQRNAGESKLPLRLSVQGANVGDAWYMVTNDPAFAPPSIDTLSTATGAAAGGTVVTLTGKGLGGARSVYFGGTAATSVTVLSETQVRATTPPHSAGAVAVTASGWFEPITKATAFTYS